MNSITIAGLSVRTTNENQQAGKDIPMLWEKLMSLGMMETIPNKTSNTIYCVYTDYEKDHTKPYTVILGYKVKNGTEIPQEMSSVIISEEKYARFSAKDSAEVYTEWIRIWNSDLKRTYIADFEIYSEDKNIEIFVGIE